MGEDAFQKNPKICTRFK